jgi:hypothetical protein
LFRRRAATGSEERTITNRPDDDEQTEKKEEMKFDWLDILAFTIAAFEIILPMIVAFVGIILVIYLILKLLAR